MSSEETEEVCLEEYCCGILGINRNATDKEIRTAYRNLARRYHPDKNKEEGYKFIDIKKAYETLVDLREQERVCNVV